jgi:hypothetical protein
MACVACTLLHLVAIRGLRMSRKMRIQSHGAPNSAYSRMQQWAAAHLQAVLYVKLRHAKQLHSRCSWRWQPVLSPAVCGCAEAVLQNLLSTALYASVSIFKKGNV